MRQNLNYNHVKDNSSIQKTKKQEIPRLQIIKKLPKVSIGSQRQQSPSRSSLNNSRSSLTEVDLSPLVSPQIVTTPTRITPSGTPTKLLGGLNWLSLDNISRVRNILFPKNNLMLNCTLVHHIFQSSEYPRPSVIRLNPNDTMPTMLARKSSLDNLTAADFAVRKKSETLVGARRRKSSMPTRIRQNSFHS